MAVATRSELQSPPAPIREEQALDATIRRSSSTDVEKEMTELIGMRAEQGGRVVGCHPSEGHNPGEVMRAHARAVQMATTTYDALPAAPDVMVDGGAQVSSRVRELARLWFKLEWPVHDESERALWRHMVQGVATLRGDGTGTRYKCSSCNQLGLTLPASRFIRLCSAWWDIPTLDKRAAVIVHEWGHHWGGAAGLMRRIFESYCGNDRFSAIPSAKLVQMPDAYMGFIYEFVTGTALTASYLCSPNNSVHPGV